MLSRFRLHVLLLPALVGISAAWAAEATPPLSLAAAIAESQRDHPDAAVALARLDEAQAHLRQATAAFMPRLSVGSTYLITNQPALAFMGLINQGAYSPSINPNKPPTVDNLNLSATIQVPLYTPGSWSARAAAVHGATAARSFQEAVGAALTLTTIQAFIAVHQAQAHVTAATATVAAHESAIAIARQRNQAGTLARADLLSLEAARAGAQGDLIAARGGLALAGQALASAMGKEGSISAIEPPPDFAIPQDANPGDKPELIGSRERVAAARSGVDQARAQNLPHIGAFGGYGYDQGIKQSSDGQSWFAGVGIEWTLYAGGATAAGIDEAEAKQLAAQAEMHRTALQIAQGRAAARIRLATVTEQVASAAAQKDAADEAERLQAERFAAGKATAADLASAVAALAQARAAVADADAGRRMTIADLRFQYGLPIAP